MYRLMCKAKKKKKKTVQLSGVAETREAGRVQTLVVYFPLALGL